MKTVKTARGKTVNMGALAQQYERERAVSNVPVNAKGDIIDNRGNVKIPREQVAKEYYKNNVPGSEEQISIKTDDEETTPVQEPVQQEPIVQEPVQQPTEPEEVIELSRRERVREDGTIYWEIEYSDGSMEIEEANNEN
jgi:hypothetical protein